MEVVAGSQATKIRGSAEDSIAMVIGTGIVVTDMATGTVTEVDMGAVLGTESRKHLRSGPDLPWLLGVSRRRKKGTGQPRPLASSEGPSLWTPCRRRRRRMRSSVQERKPEKLRNPIHLERQNQWTR